MNNRFRTLGTSVGLTAAALFLAAGAAFGADVPLSVLNAGPSSAEIPVVAGDRVATFAFPREIVNADVPFASVVSLADATLVQDANDPNAGIRVRSRAIVPGSAGFNGNAAFVVVAQPGFDADAETSYILFLNQADAANIDTIAELDAFIADAASNFVQIFLDDAALNGGGGFADTDLEEADLVDGIIFEAAELAAADATYDTFDLAIVVFTDAAGTDPDVATEYACVDPNGNDIQVTAAVLDETDDQTLRLAFNTQLLDDDVNNLMDIVTADVNGADFRVRVGGAGGIVTTLAAWLNGLAVPNSVVNVDVVGDMNNILEIEFNDPLTGAELEEFLGTTIWIAPGNDIDGVAGQTGVTTEGNIAIGRADNLAFTTAQLLQGSGQDGFGLGTREIWVAVDFSETVTDPGDNDQFELLNAAGDVIAVSDLVQTTLPTNVAVPGINDANLDGTATDNVIEEAGTRVFARFVLVDGDDAINSDATWSDDGQDDIEERNTRSAISVRIAEGFIGDTASNALGGVVDIESTANLTDLARPIAIAALTRAGDTGEFGEFVDQVDLIFDETVQTNANTTTFTFLGYNSGETISDLTAGLGAGLSIPTIDIVTTATVNDRRLTATSSGLATNFINNDTLAFGAPEVPVDGTANNGETEIFSGTGDEAYIIAFRNAAVTDAGGRGATVLGTFNGMNELTGGFEVVADGAAPALMAANVDEDLDDLVAGFSENVSNPLNTFEAESFFVVMENDAVGRRFNIEGADVFFPGDNTVEIDLDDSLDEEIALDPGYNLSVYNPGHPIVDAAGNEIDPNVAKLNLVLITPPAAEFEDTGIAFVDDDNDKVVEIRLRVTGPVELSADGDLDELANRFFIRGDDFGADNGELMELGGLIEDIEIADEANGDGSYDITLILMDGMSFPQEDFFVEYVDTDDLASPADSFLVTPVDSGEVEIASAVIYVSVLRPPVVEGDENSPHGNPLTMTVAGTLKLNNANALGARISAHVWLPDEGFGTATFTFRGVVHTATLEPVVNGQVLYFHPQPLGEGVGAVSPMGIINGKPELDITATVTLTRQGQEDGEIVDIEEEVLLYQNLNNLGVPAIVRPIQLTFRDDPTCPGRFTIQGAGITNGSVVYPGEFEEIGFTVVTSPVLDGEPAEVGARPYTLHTRGEKGFKGLPVVIVVQPEEFFAEDEDCFLANTMIAPNFAAPAARAFTFLSDIDRTGANALPFRFNIDRSLVTAFDLSDYEQDDWALLPVPTNQGDYGASGNLPNRVMAGNTVLTSNSPIPQAISLRGGFVVLDDDCEPELLDATMALAIDNRGVFCGDLCNLNRFVSGYGYGIQADNLNGRRWFTFGPRFTSGATLQVNSASNNGGWNLLANLRNMPVAAGSFGGQVNITMMDETGVRVWANGFADNNDLETIGVNEAVLIHSTSNFNSTP